MLYQYAVYVHRHGASISTTVDAYTDEEARTLGIARFVEVNNFDPTGGLIYVDKLRPASVRAPFVAFATLLVDVTD